MSFTPSPLQAKAIKAIKDWYRNRTNEQQTFRLFGYAGTGKSTVLKSVLEELGLSMTNGSTKRRRKRDDDNDACVPDVVVATFTGKAAYVLRRKGTPARTIHSLIYSYVEASEEQIEQQEKAIREAEEVAVKLSGMERVEAEAFIGTMRLQLRTMKKGHFALNPDSDAANTKLIVLDEVSMVGPDMAKDLLSFGKPILVLGDPGQLPPIKGEGAFTQAEPDIMLTEVHRQAQESAIIRLATMARNSEAIGYGQYDEFVWKMSKMDVTPAQMLRGGQVICGMNATRFMLNNAMRREAGFHGRLPTGPDEKIICLKNNNDLGLINGMFVTLEDITDDRELSFAAKMKDEDGKPIGGASKFLNIYKGDFEDHFAFDKNRDDRDWRVKRSLNHATFGWAISGHKSQGSQWENVIVWDDGWGRTKEDRARWLYTVLTRAERGLVILS